MQHTTDPYNSLNVTALLHAILESPLENYDLGVGSPRVLKLAHLLVVRSPANSARIGSL